MDNKVYIVTLYRGENANEINEDITSDNYIKVKDRMIMAVFRTKEKALKLKERYQKKANEYEFGDYHKYFVETCIVED